MRFHALVPLAAAAANLIICVAVLKHGIRKRDYLPFALLTLTIVAWNLDIFSLYHFTDRDAAQWWSTFFRTGIVFAPAASLHATFFLFEARSRLWDWLLRAGYATGAVLAVANFGGFLAGDMIPHRWGWYIEATPLYGVFTALLLVYLPVMAYRVYTAFRHPSSARQRVQAKFWLVAVVVQIPFVLTNLLPIYGINVYPLGSFGSVLYVGVIGYGIVRHRLMDLDYVVRKFVSFTFAAGVVLVPSGIGLFTLAEAVGARESMLLVYAAVAMSLLSALIIPTLQQALETRLHRAFFPERYDRRVGLQQLANALVHVVDRRELVTLLGDTLVEVLDLEHCEVYLYEERSKGLLAAYPDPDATDTLSEETIRGLEALAGPALASEVEASVAASAETFRARQWEVGIPLRIAGRLIGFIALGRNRDFRIFTAEDLQMLETISASTSVALENVALSRQLRRSELVLERANRLSSVGMLAAGIAHEIRNPLVAVKTFLDLLPQRLNDNEFLTHFRDLSLSELRRVTDLIADLLALGRSSSTQRRAIEPRPTLEPVLRLMESTARKRQVELSVVSEGSPPPVWADADQLKQIVLNLLLNAIEVSPPGGHIVVELREHDGGRVALEVRDQGAGIPEAQLSQIFDPFFTTKESGTGLGLALVHQMVVEHGGEITVDSRVGVGTTFRVTLPTAEVELTRTATESSAA
jgi:signal transduction histidine kinase